MREDGNRARENLHQRLRAEVVKMKAARQRAQRPFPFMWKNSLFSPQPTDPDNQETLFVDDAASSTSLHSFRPDLGFPRASPTDVYCRENATRSHRIAHQPRERRAALPIPNPHRGEGLGSVLSRPLPSGTEHELTRIRDPLRMQALRLHSSSR